jgi:phosphoenolpyruvate synthase/pyruvate phosphate dikinase
MPPKKASTTGAATLQRLDPNQDVVSLREAQSQKRKAISPTPPEDDLDQEIQKWRCSINRFNGRRRRWLV